MKQKVVIVPFEGGYAKLLFNLEGDNWICTLPVQSMSDLQSAMNGEPFREIVGPYIDGDGLWD